MFSVKVSQGNSLENSEMFSHMLSSNPTETLPVKFLKELSFNSISLTPVSFFFPGSKTKSSKCSDLPSFLNVKNPAGLANKTLQNQECNYHGTESQAAGKPAHQSSNQPLKMHHPALIIDLVQQQ